MRGRAEHLDRQYTAWGRVLEGLDVVLSITTGEPPANPDILQRAVLAADLPEGEALRARVPRMDGATFTAWLAEHAPTGEEDVCTLPPVPAVITR